MDKNLLAQLDALGITYDIMEHEAVATVAQAEKFWKEIKGMHCKNLFLRDKKGRQHYLVVAEKDSKVPMDKLNLFLGNNERLSFASEKRMMKYLQLTPGSVSPFGIINDAENHVIVLLDSRLQGAEIVNFHPNINTSTLSIALPDFEKFLDWSKNPYQYIEL